MKILISLLLLSLFLFLGCENTEAPSCKGVLCTGRGVCVADGSSVRCECDPGYHDENLECVSTKCDPACKEGENCVVQDDGSVSCVCGGGYHLEGDNCIKNETECDPACNEHEVCKKTGDNSFTCSCDTNYKMINDVCIFICNENSDINSTNDGCDCKDGFYNDNEVCLPKIGCHADDTDCGNGVCKDDLEKDFYCICNDGYFFNGTTCVEISCFNQVLCGDSCCSNDQICMRGACVAPGRDCTEDGECDLDQFCDPIMAKCIEIDKDDSNGCYFNSGNLGVLTPLTAWKWPNATTSFQDYKHVIMTPVVANLTDDNNDGNIDLQDIPDIIFTSYKRGAYGDQEGYHFGYLRIVDGKTGADIATKVEPMIDGGAGMTVAKVNGKMLIIAMQSDRKRLVAFSYNDDDGIVVEWTQDTEINHESGWINEGMPAIADLDHDGVAEVVIGNYILNATNGVERCHSTDTLLSYGNNSDWAIDSDATDDHTNRRYATIIEDTNADGIMDIITGNQFFSGADCSSLVKREDRKDGFTAIADLNNDDTPEVVVISNGWLYIYDIVTMSDLITPLQIDAEASGWPKYPIGGPPTIANFDDDANLEIAVAGKTNYQVIDVDLSTHTAIVKWEKETKDKSSRETGSSLFDFEGDGRAEVLYADECYFRIYDGETGDERFKIKNSSGTILEYPLVVDLDNDGKSEILLVANASENNVCDWGRHSELGNFGLRVFEDTENRWVRTRRIWNEHSYHITNINEDGTLPTTEEHNWESYNNYRLNSQGKGVFNAPDLEITRVDVTRVDCPSLTFKFNITILNKGSLTAAKDLPVAIYKGTPTNPIAILGVVKTTKYLKPGEREELTFSFSPTNPDNIYQLFVAADDKGNGHGEYNECDENNNNYPLSFKGAYRVYCQTGVGECMRFAPYTCDNNNNLICSAVAGEPIDELCNDGFDNNCDGEIDEGCGCNSGSTQDCYSGRSTLLVSNARCEKGTQTCIGGEFWNNCIEDILPIPEKCNGIDDDCDGDIDENFQVGESCTVGLGICERDGHYKCDSLGNQVCDATAGTPDFEICGNGLDDNCNGQTDERPCSGE